MKNPPNEMDGFMLGTAARHLKTVRRRLPVQPGGCESRKMKNKHEGESNEQGHNWRISRGTGEAIESV